MLRISITGGKNSIQEPSGSSREGCQLIKEESWFTCTLASNGSMIYRNQQENLQNKASYWFLPVVQTAVSLGAGKKKGWQLVDLGEDNCSVVEGDV